MNEETVLGGTPGAEGGPAAADIDEKVFTEAVRRGLITAPQGSAALEEARGRGLALLEVLRRKGLLSEEAARDLDEETREDFVPGFRVLSKLGEGGMGVVYKALQKRLDREVALKVVMPRLASDPSYLRRFEREAKAVARLNHPNIVAAYDYGESKGRVFLAMEFVDGVNCGDWIRKNGPMEEDRALALVRDVAAGLAHAHAAGIIHRDIKPGNILLANRRPGDTAAGTSSGAKLTDLGLARMGNQSGATELTAAGAILGTPGYMAPEQAFGREVDHRADIYALGATLYQLVTGQRPFDATTPVAVIARQQSDVLADPRDLRPGLSAGLAVLLQGMLSRDPSTRYAGYRELLADLDLVRGGKEPGRPLPPPEHRSLADFAGAAGPGTVALPQRGAAPSRGATALPPPQEAAAAAPPAPPAAAAPPPARSKAPFIAVGLVLALVAVLAVAARTRWKREAVPKDPGTAGPGPKEGPEAPRAEADPFPDDAEKAVARDLDEGNERAAFSRVLEAWKRNRQLPPGQGQRHSPRLAKALERTRLAMEDRIHGLLRNGEYGKALELARWAKGELGDQPSARLDGLLKALEAAGERGAAERAALRAAGDAVKRDDPEAALAALEAFETKYDFSPDLDRVKEIREWAEREAPVVRVESDPAGALLLVGGKEAGKTPVSFRARVGQELAVELRLGGFEPERRSLRGPREEAPVFQVGLKPARAPDPEPAVLLVPAGEPRPLWTGAGLGRWSPAGGEWNVSDPGRTAMLEGEEKKEPAAVLRGRSVPLGLVRLDLAPFVRDADGWRLEWQMIGEARRTGNTVLVEMQFAVRESGSAIVLGIDDQDVYLGTRDGASKVLVRTHGLRGPAANFPHTFAVECHGDVFVAFVDRRRVGAVAAPKDLAEARTVRAAVEGGSGYFSDVAVTRMRRP